MGILLVLLASGSQAVAVSLHLSPCFVKLLHNSHAVFCRIPFLLQTHRELRSLFLPSEKMALESLILTVPLVDRQQHSHSLATGRQPGQLLWCLKNKTTRQISNQKNTRATKPEKTMPEETWGRSLTMDETLKTATQLPTGLAGQAEKVNSCPFRPWSRGFSAGRAHTQTLLFMLCWVIHSRVQLLWFETLRSTFSAGDGLFIFSPAAFHATELHHVLISFLLC